MPDNGARWSIGLAGWVIQDGNYDDFSVGRAEVSTRRLRTQKTNGVASQAAAA